MSAYTDAVLADSPIAYWRLGESSGTNANDETANNNDATYVNAPTLGAASLLASDANTAVTLNGTTQTITVADSTPFRGAGTAAFSFECWYKHVSDGSLRNIVSCLNGNGWLIYAHSGDFGFVRKTPPANDYADVQPGPTSNVKHHVVATYDGTNMKLYIDSALIETTASPGSLPSDSTFVIGGPSPFFNGTIDEVAFYSTALSAARVLAHYNAAFAHPSAQAVLVA